MVTVTIYPTRVLAPLSQLVSTELVLVATPKLASADITRLAGKVPKQS